MKLVAAIQSKNLNLRCAAVPPFSVPLTKEGVKERGEKP